METVITLSSLGNKKYVLIMDRFSLFLLWTPISALCLTESLNVNLWKLNSNCNPSFLTGKIQAFLYEEQCNIVFLAIIFFSYTKRRKVGLKENCRNKEDRIGTCSLICTAPAHHQITSWESICITTNITTNREPIPWQSHAPWNNIPGYIM